MPIPKKANQDEVIAKAMADTNIRVALDQFVNKHPDVAQVLHTNHLHIEHLERIIEKQDRKIEKLIRQNERLKSKASQE